MIRNLIATCLIISLNLIPLTTFQSVASAQSRGLTRPSSAAPASEELPAEGRILSSAQAKAERGGVRIQWRSNSARESIRLHIYRIRTGLRTFEAIPADSLASITSERAGAGYLYEWFDRDGTADSIYYLDSANLNGQGKTEDALVSLTGSALGESRQKTAPLETSAGGRGLATASSSMKSAAPALVQPQATEASTTNQWSVAAQVALKIQIKTEGWYRVTQQQMVAAGFVPAVDIKNLSLFADGDEFAIRTSKASGQLSSGDYIEFYGQGLDTLDTNTRIYYLIAGTSPGQRLQSDPQTDVEAIQPTEPAPGVSQTSDFTYRGWFAPLLTFRAGEEKSTTGAGEALPSTGQGVPQATQSFRLPPSADSNVAPPLPNKANQSDAPAGVAPDTTLPVESVAPVAPVAQVTASAPKTSRKSSKSRSRNRRRKAAAKVDRYKPRYNHAAVLATTLSFNDTVQVKERFNYNPQLAAGLNFFGSALSAGFSLTRTLVTNNLQSNPDALASLEVALQGVSLQSHQVDVFCNNVLIGTLTNFFGRDRKAQTFTFPASLLVEGNNQFKMTPGPAGEFLGFDHLLLTYPRGYRALNDSLRFTARPAQTFKVDGFSTPNIQLLDISDPSRVTSTIPVSEVSGAGFAITVPPAKAPKKGRTPIFGIPERQPLRTLFALPQGQFSTPAGLSLNQPSTLNQSGNVADLLIIAAKDFIPSLAPLVAKRQSEGLSVVLTDVDDVYDEFSFGAKSTQALPDFLARARSSWAKAPRYVLLAGDASYDPRGNIATAMTRSQVRQHDGSHPGCADLANNARDFSMALFPLPRNSNFNATPCSNASGVVISEVYDGGGDRQIAYANGYIELFNRGSSPVNVSGWSVQYASATGTTWQVTNLPSVTIAAGHYYLVAEAGLGGNFPLTPTPDVTGTISINRKEGKIALVNSTTPLAGACPSGANIVDFLGYGSAANCFQGSGIGSGPAPVSSDFVPTMQVDTLFGVACSDDALTDFVNDDGIPEIPVGRLPARTPAEMELIVSKIVTFLKTNVPQTALFVADAQGTYYWNFETHSDELANLVPAALAKQKIYLASQASPAACQANIINSINQGVALVNYQGHGNVNVWSGASIFSATDAGNLTNGNRLPLVIVADCLNGLFNDPVLEGLGETILKAPNGGAVAAYASSGETIPDGQQEMSIRVFQLLFGAQSVALGDITKQAKGAVTNDLDVRRTWILLGDPSMKIF